MASVRRQNENLLANRRSAFSQPSKKWSTSENKAKIIGKDTTQSAGRNQGVNSEKSGAKSTSNPATRRALTSLVNNTPQQPHRQLSPRPPLRHQSSTISSKTTAPRNLSKTPAGKLKLKKALAVYAPLAKDVSHVEDDVDDVEYMPPPIKETGFQPPTPMRGHATADDLVESPAAPPPNLDLDLTFQSVDLQLGPLDSPSRNSIGQTLTLDDDFRFDD